MFTDLNERVTDVIFHNDTATIKIFLNGLKNVHTLATKVYEKGPQSLADTIKEVEKLQATQQITSTLLPPSLVNTMSTDNDKCFQCQEVGHMACYCPHIRCFNCNNYGHITVGCPDKIPPSGMSAWCRDNTSSKCDRLASWNSHTRCSHHDHRDRHRFSHSQSCSHNPRYRSNSHSDSHKSHSRSFHWPSCHSFLHHRSSSTYCYCHDTPHHRSSSSRHFSRDDSRSRTQRSSRQHYKPAQRSSSSSQSTPWKPKDRRHKQVTIDDPPSKYYSSDEQDSDSEDDLN